MYKFIFFALLGLSMSIGVVSRNAQNFPSVLSADTPEDFVDPPPIIDDNDVAFECRYEESFGCRYIYRLEHNFEWNATVNGEEAQLNIFNHFQVDDTLNTAWLESNTLVGAKCLYFSVYTTSHDINWAISVNNYHTETFTPLPAKRHLTKKMTVGLSNKPYKVGFHLYGFAEHQRPISGRAYIGRFILVNGPCPEDLSSLNCTFETNFCDWSDDDSKYIWYHIPFRVHPTIPHRIIFGALASFAGKGVLYSTIVQPADSKCFSFIYAKGEGRKSHLRVWLLYRIPFSKDIKTLLYEDVSDRKFLKKRVHVNIFIPFDYQIAFEGRSKTILHGVVVLHTSITAHRCPGTGTYMNVIPDVPDISKMKSFTASTGLPDETSTGFF